MNLLHYVTNKQIRNIDVINNNLITNYRKGILFPGFKHFQENKKHYICSEIIAFFVINTILNNLLRVLV